MEGSGKGKTPKKCKRMERAGRGGREGSGKKVKVKERIAVNGFPSHSYGTSLAIWDHTVLPATRHK